MKIEGLQNCRYLTTLSLKGNGIKQIENLDKVPLRFLDLVSYRLALLNKLRLVLWAISSEQKPHLQD
jgi:hypothetical protein